MSRPSFILPLLVAWLVAAPSGVAQIDLPKKPIARPSASGVVVPPLPRGDLAERVAGSKTLEGLESSHQGSGQGLDLPDARDKPAAKKPAVAPAVPGATAPQPAGESSIALPPAGAPGPVAAFVLDEVQKVKDPSSAMLRHAAQSLLAMGEPGLEAARRALVEEHGPSLLLGERVLLTAALPSDRALVVERLRHRLPSNVCALAVDELVALDPVSASPRFLVELLSHPQSGVRTAAQRQLAAQASPELLEPLALALRANLADARLRGVQLLEGIRGPAVMALLLERMADRSPQVAARAIQSLSTLDDERLEPELLRRAFGLQWVLREQSLALIVLMEREDRGTRAILSEIYCEPLLQGLSSSDAFVAGTCASALAGIGFRSVSPSELAWLDRDVPHRLVRVVGGQDFVDDLSVLLPVATRRLALLSGRAFGSDGPAWISWWTVAAPGFFARRAVLPVRPEDAPRVRISYVSSLGEPQAFRLLGPEVGAAADTPLAPMLNDALAFESFTLSQTQARELFELCVREGVFGAERLPGARDDSLLTASSSSGSCAIDVAIGTRAKSFRFGSEAEPWFEHIAEASRSLRERCEWQRFFEGDRSPESEAWRAEVEWWDESHSDVERDRRLAALVLAALPRRPRTSRDDGVAALARLAGRAGAIQPLDFHAVVELMRDETFLGPRARALLSIARGCASEAGTDGVLEPTLARDLIAAVLETFGTSAAPELSELLRASGPDQTRAAAKSEAPFLRAVAAATLASGAKESGTLEEADLALLMQLVRDPVPEVEAAAVLALGENRVEAARTELLVRARLGAKPVRCAALVAIGELGGESVIDALLIALAERDPDVVTAAARGLARLNDPAATPLLISLLAKDRNSSVFQAAREGLLALGPAAWGDLLRAVYSPAPRAKREAALILSMQGVPQAAPTLMTVLTENPGDVEVAGELAVLTCQDFRRDANPAATWWRWWEMVVHDDSLAWLCGALARLGEPAPPPDTLAGAGTQAGARFLLVVLEREEAHLVERARRELARLLERELEAAPPLGRERAPWIAKIAAEVHEHWK